ncbi:MAG: DegT/DnrJ/EryC1/StrS family aminotransferase [Acidobacteriaceae bacterium]|nr:DegT/DnrJ/EryC1/StrS family aminotransferase [Acidobacteriaceae bacterium]
MEIAEKIMRAEDLAIATGTPLFSEPLHVGRPNLGSEEALLSRIREVIGRRWFTNYGPMVQEFEDRLKQILGVRHCIPICNGTVALEIAIRAAELKGEVIVPSFTFVATAHALQWQEITPVFCDIAAGSHNLDPEQAQRLITPRTSGIIGVHVWGKACAHDELTDLARRRGLKLMYDASHALGCSLGGTPIGNFGLCEVFSFHATKFLNSFEGGAIATNDDELARKIRLMKNFGFSGVDQVTFVGTNGKMNEISAAMGITGLESMSRFVETNRRNYQLYRSEMEQIKGVKMVLFDERERHNYQYIVFEIQDEVTGISRDELVRILTAENVLARRYFFPGCHRMEPYRSYFPHAGLLLPHTEELCNRVLVLPTGTAIGQNEIHAICGIIRTALAYPNKCKTLLNNLRTSQLG